MRRATDLLLLLGSGALLVPTAIASPLAGAPLPTDPTPQSPYAVWVRFEVEILPSLDAFAVRTLAMVEEAPLEGLEGIPAQAVRDGGPAVHAVFEERVQLLLDSQLRSAFPGAAPQRTQWRVAYGESDADADPYKPGVLVDATSRVPLTPAALGVGGVGATSGPDLARAFLYSGGRVHVSRDIPVPAGVSATVALNVPPSLRLAHGDGPNTTRLEFPRDNLQGAHPAPLRLSFVLAARPELVPANVREGPLVRATFLAHDKTPLWLQAFPLTHGRFSADLDLWIDLASLPASLLEQMPLPPGLELETVSADLLRVALRAGLLSPDDLHRFFAVLIEDSLHESFGEDVDVKLDRRAFETSLDAPLGSGTAAGVRPLQVHAAAHLPLKSEKMLWSSAIGRAVGMVGALPASFPISNQGSWATALTLLYPPGVRIDVTDDLGRAVPVRAGDRDGFTLTLHAGETTTVHIRGQVPFDPLVFSLGVLELAALGAAGWQAFRRGRDLIRRGRLPWPAVHSKN